MIKLTNIAAVAALALTLTVTDIAAKPAEAHNWGWGPGLGVGIASGLILGGIIASERANAYPPTYYYGAPYPQGCVLGAPRVRWEQVCHPGWNGEIFCHNERRVFRPEYCN
jgi:hypothetical protein